MRAIKTYSKRGAPLYCALFTECGSCLKSHFLTLTSLFYKKSNLLESRVIIHAYNHHVRLLAPEPLVVRQPKLTRVKEPTLLCNHWPDRKSHWTRRPFSEGVGNPLDLEWRHRQDRANERAEPRSIHLGCIRLRFCPKDTQLRRGIFGEPALDGPPTFQRH